MELERFIVALVPIVIGFLIAIINIYIRRRLAEKESDEQWEKTLRQIEIEKEMQMYKKKTWDYQNPIEKKQKGRLVCEYCGCISGKDHGTCEHCGAVLTQPKSADLYEVMKQWW